MNTHLHAARTRPWQVALVAGGLLVAVYFTLPPGGVVQALCYDVIGLAAVGVMFIGIRLHRPENPTPWVLLAVGTLFSTLGDAVSTGYQVAGVALPNPSFADVPYLASYPFLFAAVLRIGQQVRQRGARERRVDALIIALGTFSVAWIALMDPYADDSSVGLWATLTLLAYPIMDLAIVYIILSVLMVGGLRDGAERLIGLAMAIMLVGDIAYDVMVLHGTYTAGNVVDVTWLASYVLLAVAALHPSMTRVGGAEYRVDLRRRNWVPIVAVAGFVSPTILILGDLLKLHVDVALLSAISVVMVALAALRMSWVISNMRRQSDELWKRSESLQEALRARETLAADLRHQAFHDSLTGLANRALLYDRVEHAMARSAREPDTVALILLDLDGFKTVNDSLGHQAGDTLLMTVAERTSAVVRPGDTVARLGGDEFAVFMENLHDIDEAVRAVDRIMAALREPASLGGRSIALSASVGIAFSTVETTTERLLSEADAAMYEAKSHGRNRHEVFEPSMRSRVVERLEFTNAFAGALERGEFFVEYQPLFLLESGQLQGFEALLRWQHPRLGLVAPLRFVPLAEETGFIVPLGRWVLEAACTAAMAWADGGTEPSIAVNLSARQLQDPGLLADVRGALARSGLPGERLVLEITEGMLVGDQEKTVELLHALKRMGISIAIDDFGTGYSSLSHLRKFPVDILKIDKSFVDQLVGAQAEGPAFVQAIIRLARELRVATVAEGIEERAQRDALASMGCDVGQGFLLSRPLRERDAAELVVHAARGDAVHGGLDIGPVGIVGVDIVGKTLELIEAAASVAEARTHAGPAVSAGQS